MRLVHISDIHFGAENRVATEAAIASICGYSPNVVIVTGDLTLGGKASEFKAAREWLSRLPRPLLVTPGNHDTPYWNLVLRTVAPFGRYRRYISPLTNQASTCPTSWFAPLTRHAVLSRSFNWSKGAVNLAAIHQAAREMKAAKAALKVLVCHHPLIESSCVGVTGGVHRGEAAARILAEAGVDLVPHVIDCEFDSSVHRPGSNYRRRFVAAKEISVKKYVVKLTGDERRHLHELIHTASTPRSF